MSGTIRIGVLGAGGIAKTGHLPAFGQLDERCEVAALYDLVPAAAQSAAEQFGVELATSRLDEALDAVDAVVVATPNKWHRDLAVAALEAGKHVLCEKPLARNAKEAADIVDAAQAAERVLHVGLQLRFASPVKFLKAYVARGEMGEVYYARAQALRRRGVPTWGVFTDREIQGGGPLVDIGVHILDLTLYLMGDPKPVAAFGRTWQMLAKQKGLYNFWGPIDPDAYSVEDFAVAQIEFDNGARVTLESSFLANMGQSEFQTQLFGTTSGAILRPMAETSLEVFTERGGQLFDLKPASVGTVDAFREQAQAFLDSIEGRPTEAATGYDGLMLNRVLDAVYRSSESGSLEPID